MKDILPPSVRRAATRAIGATSPVPPAHAGSLLPRRTLEVLQDVVATLLMLLLLVLSLQALWRLGELAIAGLAATTKCCRTSSSS